MMALLFLFLVVVLLVRPLVRLNPLTMWLVRVMLLRVDPTVLTLLPMVVSAIDRTGAPTEIPVLDPTPCSRLMVPLV